MAGVLRPAPQCSPVSHTQRLQDALEEVSRAHNCRLGKHQAGHLRSAQVCVRSGWTRAEEADKVARTSS